jgi:hypothetical protein
MPVAAAKILTRPTLFDAQGKSVNLNHARNRQACAVGPAAALSMTACAHTTVGNAVRSPPGIDEDSRSPVDVDIVLLEQSQMRAITGAGDDLTIIPSMDGKSPVDIDHLARAAPPQCRWYFAETQTFGPDVEEFHKTTYQNPPDGALISQGAAAYRDPVTARRAFDGLIGLVHDCGSTVSGPVLVGDWTASGDAISTRTDGCGRDYRLKSVVLVEVTFWAFPANVPDIVATNVLANVPG